MCHLRTLSRKCFLLSASLLSAPLIQLQNEDINFFAISNLLARYNSSCAQWPFQLFAEIHVSRGGRAMLSYDKHITDMDFGLYW